MAGKSIDVQYDHNAIPLLGLVLEQVTSDLSTSGGEGRLFVRSDTHLVKVILNAAVKVLATTDDARFTDSRTPTGSAGGSLSGTYPNPGIANNAVTLATLALALIQSGVSSGTAATTDPALRKLGTGANDAMAGNRSLDTITAPAGDVSMNTHKITNVVNPSSAQDAATKAYVDSVAQGLDAKASARLAYISGLGIGNLATSAPLSVDGTNVVTGNRVLVADGTANGGIWEVVSPGSGANGVWTRATDMDTWAEVPGAFVFVEEGTSFADTGWVCTNNATGTLGTTVVTWTQFSSAGAYTAGAGLTLTGLDLSVNVDGSSLEINTDTLRVKALGILNSMIANGTIDLTTKVTGVLPATNGGKSAIIASPALTAGTWTDVTHSLGVKAGRVLLKVASTGEVAELGVRDKSGSETTTIQIKTDIAAGRAANYYDVYVGI